MENTLTLEQQFKLRTISEDVNKLSEAQAKECLVKLIHQNMVKDNLLKEWMKR